MESDRRTPIRLLFCLVLLLVLTAGALAQPTAETMLPGAPATTAAEQAWEKIPVQYQNARIIGAALGAIALATEDQIFSGGGGGYGGYGGLGGAGLGGFGNGLGGGGFG